MEDSAREMLLDFIFEIGDPEELSKMGKFIRSSCVISEACKKELKKVSIERYLDGVMSTAEEEHFEKMMAEDQEMVYELSLRKKVNEAIEFETLKDILDEVCKNEIHLTQKEEQRINSLYKELNKGKRRIIPLHRKYKKWLAAASITLLMLFGGSMAYHLQTRDTLGNRLFDKYYEPFDETIRYALNSNSLSLAQQKYKKGEYNNAYLLFDQLPSSIHINSEKHLFMGLSLMEMERFDEAIQNFDKVTQYETSVGVLPEMRWYRGLCYLRIGEIEKAKNIFRIIVNRNERQQEKASKILRKLE